MNEELQLNDERTQLKPMEAGPEPLFLPSQSDVLAESKQEGRLIEPRRVNFKE